VPALGGRLQTCAGRACQVWARQGRARVFRRALLPLSTPRCCRRSAHARAHMAAGTSWALASRCPASSWLRTSQGGPRPRPCRTRPPRRLWPPTSLRAPRASSSARHAALCGRACAHGARGRMPLKTGGGGRHGCQAFAHTATACPCVGWTLCMPCAWCCSTSFALESLRPHCRQGVVRVQCGMHRPAALLQM
jgi:hypothetical protein